jgi:hypothetical protein
MHLFDDNEWSSAGFENKNEGKPIADVNEPYYSDETTNEAVNSLGDEISMANGNNSSETLAVREESKIEVKESENGLRYDFELADSNGGNETIVETSTTFENAFESDEATLERESQSEEDTSTLSVETTTEEESTVSSPTETGIEEEFKVSSPADTAIDESLKAEDGHSITETNDEK